MKKFIKLITVVALLFSFSCEESNGDFSVDPNLGWVEFSEPESATISIDSYDASVPLRVIVENNVSLNNGLTVEYDLVPVSGPDPNTVFSNSGSISIEPGTGGFAVFDGAPSIFFDISEAASISETMVFDVVLTGTSNSSIDVGLANGGRNTTHRITICSSLDASVGAFIGDYTLSLPDGDGPFGAQFEDGSTVTLSEGSSGPFSRTFTAFYLPNIFGNAIGIDFEFLINYDAADGAVVEVLGTYIPGVSCDGGVTPITIIGDDGSDVPCGDDVVELNMIDFALNGACGADEFPFVMVLTKN
jgi:hypothetical protein